jgi:hypothetical protein
MDRVNAVFCLVVGLVVVQGGYLKLDLKVFHKLLPEVGGDSTVSVRNNRVEVTINVEYLVLKDLGSLFSINIPGDREQVCIATEVIKNNKHELTFLVTR